MIMAEYAKTIIKANTYEEAEEVAKEMGYGKEFRIEEVNDG